MLGVPWDAGCCGTHRDGSGCGMLWDAELRCGAGVPQILHVVWGTPGWGGRSWMPWVGGWGGCGVCAAGVAVCPAVGCRACAAAGCSPPPFPCASQCSVLLSTPPQHPSLPPPSPGSQRGGFWGCSTVPPHPHPHPRRPRPHCTALIAMLELMRLAVQVRARCHGTAHRCSLGTGDRDGGGPVGLRPPPTMGSSAWGGGAGIPQCPGVGWGLPSTVALCRLSVPFLGGPLGCVPPHWSVHSPPP